MEDSLPVEPERVDADYPVPSPCFILLLVVDHPEFPLLIMGYADMSGSEDAIPLSDYRIFTIFGKGPGGIFCRCVSDGVIF